VYFNFFYEDFNMVICPLIHLFIQNETKQTVRSVLCPQQHACKSSIGEHHNPFSRFRYILPYILLLLLVSILNNNNVFNSYLGANSRRNSFQSCSLLSVGQVLSSFPFYSFFSILDKFGLLWKLFLGGEDETLLKNWVSLFKFCCIYFMWFIHGTLETCCFFKIPFVEKKNYAFFLECLVEITMYGTLAQRRVRCLTPTQHWHM
jgi:hypothetical protein